MYKTRWGRGMGELTCRGWEKDIWETKMQDRTNHVMVFLAAAKQISAVPTTNAVFFKAAIISCLLSYTE